MKLCRVLAVWVLIVGCARSPDPGPDLTDSIVIKPVPPRAAKVAAPPVTSEPVAAESSKPAPAVTASEVPAAKEASPMVVAKSVRKK